MNSKQKLVTLFQKNTKVLLKFIANENDSYVLIALQQLGSRGLRENCCNIAW